LLGIACIKVIFSHPFYSERFLFNVPLATNETFDDRSINLREAITSPELAGREVLVSLNAVNSIGSSNFSNIEPYTIPSSSTGTLVVHV